MNKRIGLTGVTAGAAVGTAIGLAAGITSMYMLDPQAGKRRRALVRDKTVHYQHKGRVYLRKAGRDFAHRMRGVFAESRSVLWQRRPTDHVIEERARSLLGRVCSHPGAVALAVTNGVLTLHGDVLQHEVDRVVEVLSSLHGVTRVQDRLIKHESSEKISALQGRGKIPPDYSMPPPGMVLAGFFGSLLGGIAFLNARKRFSKVRGETKYAA